MSLTQDGRLLYFASPLPKDFLLLNKFRAVEGLSQLFQLELELVHEELSPGYQPTIVDIRQLLGRNVTVGIDQTDGTKRFFNGIINTFSQHQRDIRFTHYRATVVPQIWVLTKIAQSRIFQNKNVPDILRLLFTGFDVTYEIQGTFEPRNYCVQYRESNWNFASRLMEDEGIYYYFEHENGKHKLILGNTPQSHHDCPSKKKINFAFETTDAEMYESAVSSWSVEHSLQSGKHTLWDYHFQLPASKLEAAGISRFDLGNNQQLEIFDYPGGYAARFDGIAGIGSEQSGELQKIFEDKQRTNTIRQQELDVQSKTARGLSDCSSLTAGHRFELANHPAAENNLPYILVSVEHAAVQSPSYETGESAGSEYNNSFICLPHGAGQAPFRPARTTSKPTVRGSQTAKVVGPAGEEIFTDKYGRVKVQFHWDREGQYDHDGSCWLRVAQGWAGKRWGMMFIPRIGMEVIVDFLEGDPDQPIITGCVYNAETMPPYALPEEKTKSTIKSDSSTGGGGFNELRFEDKKGSEQIFIHGEKNVDVRIKNDSLEYIGKDRHLIVKNDQYEKVEKDKHTQVVGDKNEKVDGSLSLKVGTDVDEKAGMKYAVEAGTEIHLKSGTTLTLETGTSLTLKVGGNFININAGGIFIKGTMVMINSGGAAGSGSGSNPDPPKVPKVADTANPGQRVARPAPQPPPVRPAFQSEAAVVMMRAAQSGTPFCEICAKQ